MSRPQHLSRRAKPSVESLESRVVLSSFTLDSQGNLFQATQSGPVKIDSGVASFAVAPNGTLYDRHSDGTMEKFANQTLTAIETGVIAFAAGNDSSAYFLNTAGGLFRYAPGGATTLIEQNVVTFQLSTDGTVWTLDNSGNLDR